MASSSNPDYILIANLLAAGAFFFYLFIAWLQFRGHAKIPPKWMKVIRYLCLFLLLTPIAARYQFSHAGILYGAAAICIVGGLIKLKQKMGI